MSIRDAIGKQEDKIPIKNVLISVFDKTGLEHLIPEILEASPGVRFISTGGTYKKVKEILGTNDEEHLIEVAEYTGFPEMDGGLVKTLHPKIHAGILAERNNPEHQRYLQEDLDGGVYIDVVVVNLYPFEEVIKKIESGEINPKTKKPYDFESARGNIDIGGPTMIRAAAKNFSSCTAICSPMLYGKFLDQIKANDGCTSFDQRLLLAKKVFSMNSWYDLAISDFMEEQIHHDLNKIKACYKFTEKGE